MKITFPIIISGKNFFDIIRTENDNINLYKLESHHCPNRKYDFQIKNRNGKIMADLYLPENNKIELVNIKDFANPKKVISIISEVPKVIKFSKKFLNENLYSLYTITDENNKKIFILSSA